MQQAPNLVLVGPMGSGKSSIGRRLATRLGLAFVDADREFHRVFVAATGNAILLRTHDSLRDQQNRMGLATLSAGSERTRRIIEQHRAIVAAVRRRDSAQAESLIDQHLDETLRLLRRTSLPARSRPSSS